MVKMSRYEPYASLAALITSLAMLMILHNYDRKLDAYSLYFAFITGFSLMSLIRSDEPNGGSNS